MKRILAAALSCALLAGSAVGFAACTNEDDQLRDAADVTITFWNPITGPDAQYMQDLVSNFNKANEGSIYVEADAQAEDNHYQRIVNINCADNIGRNFYPYFIPADMRYYAPLFLGQPRLIFR